MLASFVINLKPQQIAPVGQTLGRSLHAVQINVFLSGMLRPALQIGKPCSSKVRLVSPRAASGTAANPPAWRKYS